MHALLRAPLVIPQANLESSPTPTSQTHSQPRCITWSPPLERPFDSSPALGIQMTYSTCSLRGSRFSRFRQIATNTTNKGKQGQTRANKGKQGQGLKEWDSALAPALSSTCVQSRSWCHKETAAHKGVGEVHCLDLEAHTA